MPGKEYQVSSNGGCCILFIAKLSFKSCIAWADYFMHNPNNFKCHRPFRFFSPQKDHYFFGALTKINTSNARSDATHWTNISPHSRVFCPLEVFVFRQSWYAAYLRGSCIVRFKCSTCFRLSTSANIREDISHPFIYLKEKKVISQTAFSSHLRILFW